MKRIGKLAKQNLFLTTWLFSFLFNYGKSGERFVSSQTDSEPSVIGRWDITINISSKAVPSWLEVRLSGRETLVGEFVGSGGSARPISRINFSNEKISFSLPPQWEKGNDLSFEGTLQSDSLTGTMTSSNGKNYNWSAVRAPSLQRQKQPAWGKPIHLLNRVDLNGWHMPGENQWKVENGILRSPKSGSNIITDQKFTDFKLHIEFRYPKGSNSGVYLRGRYEVQIIDDESEQTSNHTIGSIYGFLPPSAMAAKKAGEWQSYDITLVGRMVTVVLNGKTVICDREIPGITGSALDSNEGEPGPLYLQGDHGAIDYRNIILTPAK